MKWLWPVVILLCSTNGAQAQWLVPPTGWFAQGDFDRPHPSGRGSDRSLSLPQLEMPNWPFPNVNATNDPGDDQTEPSIAIDPQDSQTLIIGANDDRTYFTLWAYGSTDGGRTWQDQRLPDWPLWATDATDPSVLFNSSGTAYFGNGHYDLNSNSNDVACFRSIDAGANWSISGNPFVNSGGLSDTSSDKYFIGADIDSHSPFHNRLYATWVEYAQPDRPRLVSSFSTDGGQSWSARVFLTSHNYFSSPIPASTPNGTLVVTFVDYALGTNEILAVRSTDGGVSFSAPQTIAHYKDLGQWRGDSATNQGYPVIKDTVCVNSFPSIAIDGSSAHSGRVYVTWCGKDSSDRARVFLSTSDDEGQSWTPPRAIEGDSSSIATDKFFSWVAVDPISGDVGIVFNDSRLDPNNVLCDLFMAHSTDGGQTFSVRRISSASCNPRVGRDGRGPLGGVRFQFFGDYINVAGWNNTWHPVWTDSRSGYDLDIYTATVQPYAPMPVQNLTLHDTIINGRPVAILSWTYTPRTTFGYPLSDYQFAINKSNGESIRLLPSTLQYIDTTGQPAIYAVSVLGATGLESIRDSVSDFSRSVTLDPDGAGVQVLLLRQPGIVGKPDVLRIESLQPCSINLTFYDELGRAIGEPISDDRIASQHSLSFIPQQSGVMFYVLRGTASNGAWQKMGRLLAE